ncbi:hypothetical protein Syun_003759 [Stephania yunnanensis]|uniref:Kinesin motor domain-containing protein n=1 Tax=Stephania yunnanensis TaxID=152371 RepID=A0AAP0L3C2_9MAGN
MAEQKNNRWNWEVPGFEPRTSFEDEQKSGALLRRYSISTSSVLPRSEQSKQALAVKVLNLASKVKHAKEEYLELRREASDLQEYSKAKIDRVTRYLGALADRARKLDQVSLETEAIISPLIAEKKRLYNELLTAKGNIKVFCRVRPLFEDEGVSAVEFPDDFTIRITTGDNLISNPKRDFEFDRVYGPHVGQGELFHDVQPFVQSALDGYNVSVFAYGQSHSGKTHSMEGSSHERGLYVRCFEELFDLSNSDTTFSSRFDFYVTAFELYNEQVKDLLSESQNNVLKVHMGSPEYLAELVQEKVQNPLHFLNVLQAGLRSRETDKSKYKISHLVVTVHIHYNNQITGEKLYSKISLVDLAGSEGVFVEDASGERVTDLLHVMKSLSALGDVLSSLTSKKEVIPYGNSRLTHILSDSLGGNSKTLLILNICPNVSNLSETVSALNFCARARNAELSLGSRDTIKKWRDIANDARKEVSEKAKEIHELKQEALELRKALKESNDQCVLLFYEVQKAWKVSLTLQSDLKSENIELMEKYRIEKDQNAQLRNQVALLLQLEQEQKMHIEQQESIIQTLKVKIKSIESQVNEAFNSTNAKSIGGSETGSIGVFSTSTANGVDSSTVAKKLEEELAKRDALIQRLHEENEKLFDRLTEKASISGTPKEFPEAINSIPAIFGLMITSPSARRLINSQSQDMARNDHNGGHSVDALPLSAVSDKTDGTVAVVKSGSEKVKTTPAGEYLTAALMDFDPEQFDSIAAIADGANKLLMLHHRVSGRHHRGLRPRTSRLPQTGQAPCVRAGCVFGCFFGACGLAGLMGFSVGLSDRAKGGSLLSIRGRSSIRIKVSLKERAKPSSPSAPIDSASLFFTFFVERLSSSGRGEGRVSLAFTPEAPLAFPFFPPIVVVLAAVIKAGAAREHEILAEIKDAVFSFIRKMEPKRVMDTMLVSRVRILYIRSLLAKSPELQSIKVSPVERFLEKANTGRSRSSSRSNSPGRSPHHYDHSTRMSLVDEHIQGFKVNIKQEKKSKFSYIVLKMRGIDQDSWKQHVTGGKLREITEEAKSFAIGNKSLAALFVHTPAGELQRQIKSWLAESFDFLSVTGGDAVGGTTGQLELLSTAIMDGWMAGLGAAFPPNTDALGQLLSEYSKRVYSSQLQHLKDIAGTLAMEEAEDSAQVSKLRSALESVDHKRRKIMRQMRNDTALLTVEQGGSPIRNPSTAVEDARLASLISLDGIMKQVKDIMKQASVSSLPRCKKQLILASLDEQMERMPSLLDVDQPCAQRQIADARTVIENVPEQVDHQQDVLGLIPTAEWGSNGAETDVTQWNVLQFNTGSTSPFIIKCGANSNSELVIKADGRVHDPKGGEIIRVVPRPTVLANMSLEDMKNVFAQLPEAISLLALARTPDGTRARYSRLYRTLAMKVPSLRDLVSELEKGGLLKDSRP